MATLSNVETLASPNKSCLGKSLTLPTSPFRSNTTATASFMRDKLSPFKQCNDLFDIRRNSQKFSDSNNSFGRESLGILPPDFGRESLGILNLSCDIRRESLGILHLSAKESFGLLNHEGGRESLGILNLNSPVFKFDMLDKGLTADIKETNPDFAHPLDKNLLYPIKSKPSAISSTSSCNSVVTFNSASLEGPSNIHSGCSSIKTQLSSKTDVFNASFHNTNEFNDRLKYLDSSNISSIHSSLNKARLFSVNEISNMRDVLYSLSNSAKDHSSSELINNNEANINVGTKHFWSCDRTKGKKKVKRISFHGLLDFDEEPDDFVFNDSVFIEARHLTSKIADGSIHEQHSDKDDMLDGTPQPEWPDADDQEKKDANKCDTEMVFKTVDKMLPPSLPLIKLKRSQSDTSNDANDSEMVSKNSINVSRISSDRSYSKIIQNISEISSNSNRLSTSKITNTSKSKDAQEILQNLSEIFSNKNISDLQKSQGQNLLCSLANLLYNSNPRSDSLDDSGHSSLNEPDNQHEPKESRQCYEVLHLCTKDLSKESDKPSISDNRENILNMSLKQKFSEPVKHNITRSFSVPVQKTTESIQSNNSSVELSKSRNLTKSVSASSNDSRLSSHNISKPLIAGKLKKAKSIAKVARKGPMKAVIPVQQMEKKKSLEKLSVTPKRSSIVPSLQSKRTSTPIHEPKLKPVAQSTPDHPSSHGRRHTKQFNTPVSPLARPQKKLPLRTALSSLQTRERSNSSSSTPNLSASREENSSKISSLINKNGRRNSSSGDLKKNAVEMRPRSFSTGKESGLRAAMNRVRENLSKSTFYESVQLSKVKNSSLTLPEKKVLTENRCASSVETSNMVLKAPRVGKENMGHP